MKVALFGLLLVCLLGVLHPGANAHPEEIRLGPHEARLCSKLCLRQQDIILSTLLIIHFVLILLWFLFLLK